MRPLPGTMLDRLDASLAGGARWRAVEETAAFCLVIVWRGLHCPVCRAWLADFDRLAPGFARRGYTLVALAAETPERIARACEDWQLRHLRLGRLEAETGRALGLYVSKNDAGEPLLEPALLALRPGGVLYAAWLQSGPYARPHASELLVALDNWAGRDFPPPRGGA